MLVPLDAGGIVPGVVSVVLADGGVVPGVVLFGDVLDGVLGLLVLGVPDCGNVSGVEVPGALVEGEVLGVAVLLGEVLGEVSLDVLELGLVGQVLVVVLELVEVEVPGVQSVVDDDPVWLVGDVVVGVVLVPVWLLDWLVCPAVPISGLLGLEPVILPLCDVFEVDWPGVPLDPVVTLPVAPVDCMLAAKTPAVANPCMAADGRPLVQ